MTNVCVYTICTFLVLVVAIMIAVCDADRCLGLSVLSLHVCVCVSPYACMRMNVRLFVCRSISASTGCSSRNICSGLRVSPSERTCKFVNACMSPRHHTSTTTIAIAITTCTLTPIRATQIIRQYHYTSIHSLSSIYVPHLNLSY